MANMRPRPPTALATTIRRRFRSSRTPVAGTARGWNAPECSASPSARTPAITLAASPQYALGRRKTPAAKTTPGMAMRP